MSYLPDDVPGPDVNADDAMFWKNCEAGRLTFRCCVQCGHVQHPPTPLCPRCRASEHEWRDAPEVAEIFTYTITHHPAHPGVRSVLPYNIIVVDFPELGHVRLISNLVDDNNIEIGMKVKLIWQTQGGRKIPRFTRA